MLISMDLYKYFKIADSDLSYAEKLDAYEALADKHYEKDRFDEFKSKYLGNLDEAMWELVQSTEFDEILVQTVQTTFPTHEHDKFVAHYRGIMEHWTAANAAG